MPRIVVTLIFAAASISIVIAAFWHTLLVAQPCVCEKCDRPATRLTADGLDMCEECSKEHMAELKENE
jgi:hypothetical protein